MSVTSIKDRFLRSVFNIPGYRARARLVVFESDDWGSIRMPSKDVYSGLLKEGFPVDRSKFNSFDSLECRSDLELLFDLLSSYNDVNGKSPIFTFNTVMANPDFDRIRQERFLRYYYELFFESYLKYYGDDLREIWTQAINSGIIKPQFHAREHVNTRLWIKDLQEGNIETRKAFDRNFYGHTTSSSSNSKYNYLTAYGVSCKSDMARLFKVVDEGLSLFRTIFGYNSESFIACNYLWPVELESYLSEKGVSIIKGQRTQRYPRVKDFKVRKKYHYTGQANVFGQKYLVRNVLFEPYMDLSRDWIDIALHQIANAFFWNKPAIISTHRINYVSKMDVRLRDYTLNTLKSLLQTIIKKYPDVNFVSADEVLAF